MIEVDGSAHSGSGTLLRYAVALAALLGEPLHMSRIRAKKGKTWVEAPTPAGGARLLLPF